MLIPVIVVSRFSALKLRAFGIKLITSTCYRFRDDSEWGHNPEWRWRMEGVLRSGSLQWWIVYKSRKTLPSQPIWSNHLRKFPGFAFESMNIVFWSNSLYHPPLFSPYSQHLQWSTYFRLGGWALGKVDKPQTKKLSATTMAKFPRRMIYCCSLMYNHTVYSSAHTNQLLYLLTIGHLGICPQ